MWQVKGVADKDEPTRIITQICSSFFLNKSFVAPSFSSLFRCQANNFIVL